MTPKPFNPVEPTIESVKDVRLLGVCAYCRRPGSDLPVIKRKLGKRQTPLKVAHAYCIVTQGGGFVALAALPQEEIDKARVYDLSALGLTHDEFNAKVAGAIEEEIRVCSEYAGGGYFRRPDASLENPSPILHAPEVREKLLALLDAARSSPKDSR